MSTVMKNRHGPTIPPSDRQALDSEQLRRDRRTAAIVVVVVLAMMALLVWLASWGGPAAYEGIDHWPMMP